MALHGSMVWLASVLLDLTMIFWLAAAYQFLLSAIQLDIKNLLAQHHLE